MPHEEVTKPQPHERQRMFERFDTPEEVFSFKLGSALKMEQQLVEVLEDLEQSAQRHEIKQALSEHREETRQHARNIEKCFKLLGQEVEDSPAPVVDALASEGTALIKKTDDALVDVVVLAAATESEHYEIAVYETLITNAEARGATDVAALLRQNLEQEKHALQVARTTMKTIAQHGIAIAATA
jgi:ferritin-like metal-binding protein YciE